MQLNIPGKGRSLTARQAARLFKCSVRTIHRWGIVKTDLLRAKEAAAYLAMSERKFFYLCEGDLDFPRPALRIGRLVPLWRRDELDAWKARQNKHTQLPLL